MRWSKAALALLALAALAMLALKTSAAEGKRLNVYAPQKQYEIALVDMDGREYIALDELMSPLGKVAITSQGNSVRLKVNATEGVFIGGKSTARIGKAPVELEGKTRVEDGRLLVPAKSIPMLLVRYLHAQVDFHETARRLFIDGAAQHFSAESKREGELALAFPAAVTPQISTDGNRLTLVFRKDALIGPSNESTFANKLVSGVEWSEADGAATLTVHGTAPLLASFAEGGKMIVISAAPATQVAQSSPPPPVAAAPSAGTAVQATPAPAIAATPEVSAMQASGPRFVVVIDAAHGGDDKGAQLADGELEKDVTLAIARKLRAELQGHGVAAMLLRDSDVTLGAEQRAAIANAQAAGLFVSVHAEGKSSVAIYTALLDPAQASGRFVPWQSAQRAQVERSKVLASTVSSEVGAKRIQVTLQAAPAAPLRMIALPAMQFDAGAGDDGEYSTKYEQTLVAALAAGIANARAKMEAQR
jgi:N-acetylmuramoyl-L-alanine amidase